MLLYQQPVPTCSKKISHFPYSELTIFLQICNSCDPWEKLGYIKNNYLVLFRFCDFFLKEYLGLGWDLYWSG